jgi:(1->4)-alpha-D-glucan 1-alpha-D-glucosylmutase
VTVASRFPRSRPGGWLDAAVALPPGGWRDALGGDEHRGAVALAELLGDAPAAVLEPVP